MNLYDHDGILLMSMLVPQVLAPGMLAATELVYDAMAERSVLFCMIWDIIIPTDEGEPRALGGLMIPNIPF